MDRLGSGIWVSVSFQIFALTAGGKCPRCGEGNCPAEEMPRRELSYAHKQPTDYHRCNTWWLDMDRPF